MVLDVPLSRHSGKRDTPPGPGAVAERPDSTLAGDRILPNQARLAGAEEVSGPRDVPLSRDSGKRDRAGPDAVFERPDTALAGDFILPNQISLVVAVEVLGNFWR